MALAGVALSACGGGGSGASAGHDAGVDTGDAGEEVEPAATFVKSYSVAGADFEPRTVVADPAGGSFQVGVVTRYVDEIATRSLVVMKVDDFGDVTWATSYAQEDGNEALSEITAAVEVQSDHIWVAGQSPGGATVVELDATGNRLGHHVYDQEGLRVELAAMEPANDGGFVLAGATEIRTGMDGAHSGGDLWLMKAGADGVQQWLVVLDGPDEDDYEWVEDLDASRGDIYIAGERDGDFWMAGFTMNGGLLFSEELGGPGGGFAKAVVPVSPTANRPTAGIIAVGGDRGDFQFSDYCTPSFLHATLPAGTIAQDTDMSLGDDAGQASDANSYVGIVGTLDNDEFIAAGNRVVCAAAPVEGEDPCRMEGVLQLLSFQAPDGAVFGFDSRQLIGPAAIGLPVSTRYAGLTGQWGEYRLRTQDQAAPTFQSKYSDWPSAFIRLRVNARGVVATPVITGVKGAHLVTQGSYRGSILAWERSRLTRLNNANREEMRVDLGSLGSHTESRVAAAAVGAGRHLANQGSLGSVLVATTSDDAITLVALGRDGTVRG